MVKGQKMQTSLPYSLIDKSASKLLLLTKQNPKKTVDIVAVAKEMGYSVFIANLKEDIRDMVVYDNEEHSIYINRDDSTEQKKFAIARGISHILLHRDENQECFVDYKNKTTYNSKEYELDNFAAALLMPKELVYKAWYKTERVKDFAKVMGVSQGAAAIRLAGLNLID